MARQFSEDAEMFDCEVTTPGDVITFQGMSAHELK